MSRARQELSIAESALAAAGIAALVRQRFPQAGSLEMEEHDQEGCGAKKNASLPQDERDGWGDDSDCADLDYSAQDTQEILAMGVAYLEYSSWADWGVQGYWEGQYKAALRSTGELRSAYEEAAAYISTDLYGGLLPPAQQDAETVIEAVVDPEQFVIDPRMMIPEVGSGAADHAVAVFTWEVAEQVAFPAATSRVAQDKRPRLRLVKVEGTWLVESDLTGQLRRGSASTATSTLWPMSSTELYLRTSRVSSELDDRCTRPSGAHEPW